MHRYPVIMVCSLLACGPSSAIYASSSTGDVGSTGGAPTSTSTGASTGTSAQTTGSTTTGSGETSTTGDQGFIVIPDVPPGPPTCDPHAEMPCPDGEKCSVDGGRQNLLWTNKPMCFPLIGDLQKGEPCELGIDPIDGLDDCAANMVCVDMQTMDGPMGRCHQFCDPAFNNGGEEASCDDPAEFCYAPGCQECGLSLCVRPCDPLLPDCSEGTGCIPAFSFAEQAFVCTTLDAQELPGPGESCNDAYQCTPGATCVLAAQLGIPPCLDSETCCTPFCDLNKPNNCPGAAMGEVCQPYFPVPFDPVIDPWSAPYNKLGFCALP